MSAAVLSLLGARKVESRKQKVESRKRKAETGLTGGLRDWGTDPLSEAKRSRRGRSEAEGVRSEANPRRGAEPKGRQRVCPTV